MNGYDLLVGLAVGVVLYFLIGFGWTMVANWSWYRRVARKAKHRRGNQ